MTTRISIKCKWFVLLLTVTASVGLTACGGSSSGGTAGVTATGKPVSGGSIVYGTDREPTCLDPHNFGDVPQADLGRQFLDSLVSMGESGKIYPWLATSWKISPDAKEYTFTLKKGVKFTDGTPFNAEAVKANFEQMLKTETADGTGMLYLGPTYKGSTVVNPQTIKIDLKRPYAPFLNVLAQAYFGMESPKAMARGISANCISPVGTGPFEVKKWTKGQSVELVRNPNYNSAPGNAKHQGPAYLEAITWKFISDPAVRYAAVQDGEANLIFNVPPSDYVAAKSDPGLQVSQAFHSGSPFSLSLNASEAPFDEIDVRKAFILGSGVSASLESLSQGVLPRVGGPLTPTTPHYSKDFENSFPSNPAEAEKLLDEAGWKRPGDGYREKDGKELTASLVFSDGFSGDTPSIDQALFEAIQANEKKIGLKVELEKLPTIDAVAELEANQNEGYGAIVNYFNSPTPDVLQMNFSKATLAIGLNQVRTYDPELESILNEAAATTNAATQEKLYYEAQQIISDKAWQLTLYAVQTRLAVRSELQGVWVETSESEPVLSDAWLAT